MKEFMCEFPEEQVIVPLVSFYCFHLDGILAQFLLIFLWRYQGMNAGHPVLLTVCFQDFQVYFYIAFFIILSDNTGSRQARKAI